MSGSTKERPILFSGPMVRAILDGRKTVTRRTVKMPRLLVVDGITPEGIRCSRPTGSTGERLLPCPFGAVGDRLWVRETYAIGRIFDETRPAEVPTFERDIPVWWRADSDEESSNRGRWRRAIHMPRWASRILLEVVSVRVERLHAITEEDARREGADRVNGHPERSALVGEGPSHREGFAQLWEDINGTRAAWSSNPWVWRVEFRRVA